MAEILPIRRKSLSNQSINQFLVVSHSLFHHWRNGCCESWFPFFWIDRVGECRQNLAMPSYLPGNSWSGWIETLLIRSAGFWHRRDIGSPVTSQILSWLVLAVHHGTQSLEKKPQFGRFGLPFNVPSALFPCMAFHHIWTLALSYVLKYSTDC